MPKSDERLIHPLHQAYRLIKAGDTTQARPLVADALRANRQNIDAWWLASYTAQSEAERRAALGHVLRLNPSHKPALEALRRLDAPRPHRAESPRPRQRFRPGMLALRVFGFACFGLVGLLLYSNFVGGGPWLAIERFLFGAPEATGYVAPGGGSALETAENAFPIVQEGEISGYGEIKLAALRRGEAHRYSFNASRGDEILIGVTFTNPGDTRTTAMELWDSTGRMVASELNMQAQIDEMTGGMPNPFEGLSSFRAIQYAVPRSSTYYVVLIARDGGAAGNYNLLITNANDPIQGDMGRFLDE